MSETGMNPAAFKEGEHVIHYETRAEWIVVKHGSWWTDLGSAITGRVVRLNSLNNAHYLPLDGAR